MSNFGEIYTRYYKGAFLFVKSYVRDEMAAEDIVSESLINLWHAMRRENVARPYSMLVTILKNESLNYLKHEAVKQAGMESISKAMKRDMDYRIATLEACEPEEIFSTEITEIVEKTLKSLSPQTLRVFEMSRYENLSVKDIALRTGLETKSVEYHITRALKALRVALKEYLSVLLLLNL